MQYEVWENEYGGEYALCVAGSEEQRRWAAQDGSQLVLVIEADTWEEAKRKLNEYVSAIRQELMDKEQLVSGGSNGHHQGKDAGLWDAIEDGDRNLVMILLRDGADVNALNNDGESPLHFAAMFGGLEIAVALLAHGADLQVVDSGGNAPLHWAAAAGQFQKVQWLVQSGADVNARNHDGLTADERCGHEEIERYLSEVRPA